MITLKEWMETFNYQITEGDTYGWTCYGPNAYALSAWNGLHDEGGWSGSVVFDTHNQIVYEVEVCDYTNSRAYRIINPLYKGKHTLETKSRGIGDEAWDDVEYTDLELNEDWLAKAEAIVDGYEYDTRVSIPLEIPEEELLTLFKMAHERDMKFNDFVEEIIRRKIKEEEEVKIGNFL